MADARTIKIPDANGNLVSYTIKDAINKRARRDITSELASDPTKLIAAIAEQNLEKYGYTIGDYFLGTTGGSTYEYTIADPDTFYGGYTNNAVVNTHHYGVVVNTFLTSAWGSTSTGYKSSTLQSLLAGQVLTKIKNDITAIFGNWSSHLISHKKLFTNNESTGCEWVEAMISALSEVQTYGSTIWSMNGAQEGECCRQLEVFRKFRFNEILRSADHNSGIYPWLRNISSAGTACGAATNGYANSAGVSNPRSVVGLILLY